MKLPSLPRKFSNLSIANITSLKFADFGDAHDYYFTARLLPYAANPQRKFTQSILSTYFIGGIGGREVDLLC